MKDSNIKVKILIIDSDEMMRIYFRDIFWIHGRNKDYEILMASNLEEAEKIISNIDTRPDTLFLDIVKSVAKNHASTIDVKDSIDFIKSIRSHKEFSDLKIILYSGPQNNSLKDTFKKIGVDGFLVKGESMPKEIIAFADQIHGRHNN